MAQMTKSAAAIKKRRRRIRLLKIRRALFLCLCLALAVGSVVLIDKIFGITDTYSNNKQLKALKNTKIPDWIDVQLIDNGRARSGDSLDKVSDIVIHYVGNPSTSAQNNRDYFNQKDTEVCSHFVVGLEGEIIQCLPLYERSVASNSRNRDTISIEVCHPDVSGEFNEDTYNSLVRLVAWLCDVSGIDADNVIRHYDVIGKYCPLYYVEHEDAWEKLKEDIAQEYKNRGE